MPGYVDLLAICVLSIEGIGAALRDDPWFLSLELSSLANSGSSTFTVAFGSNVTIDVETRTQSAVRLKPNPRRISTIASGVVPGTRPVMHTSEKSVGKETLGMWPTSLK